jgi:hypothetical protein
MSRFNVLLLISLFSVTFVLNGYKLSQCDFREDYKCEVIHSIGVFIPTASVITVFFDTDA